MALEDLRPFQECWKLSKLRDARRRRLLVEPRNGPALAHAMLEMLRMPGDPIERMGEESLRLVHERFDVRRVNESTLAATGL